MSINKDPFHEITLQYLVSGKHKKKIFGDEYDDKDDRVPQHIRDIYQERIINLAKHLFNLNEIDTDDIYSDVKDSFEQFLKCTIEFLKDLDEKEKCVDANDESSETEVDKDEYNESEEITELHTNTNYEGETVDLEEICDLHNNTSIGIIGNRNLTTKLYTSPSYNLDNFVSVKSLPTNKKKYGKK